MERGTSRRRNRGTKAFRECSRSQSGYSKATGTEFEPERVTGEPASERCPWGWRGRGPKIEAARVGHRPRTPSGSSFPSPSELGQDVTFGRCPSSIGRRECKWKNALSGGLRPRTGMAEKTRTEESLGG